MLEYNFIDILFLAHPYRRDVRDICRAVVESFPHETVLPGSS